MENNGREIIEFGAYKRHSWHILCNAIGLSMVPLEFDGLVIQRGIDFSEYLQSFINLIRRHIQLSINIRNVEEVPAMYVLDGKEHKPLRKMVVYEGGRFMEQAEFRLTLYAVNSDAHNSKVPIKQTYGKLIDYEPVRFVCPEGKVTNVTVARLHFGEITKNNQRKNGRPNPEQQYFRLVVEVQAVDNNDNVYPVMAYASDEIIVRN